MDYVDKLADLKEEKQILLLEMNDTRFWMHADWFEFRLSQINTEIHEVSEMLAFDLAIQFI